MHFEDGGAIKDKRVLQAMNVVPRHKFVLKEYHSCAYDDRPLPIGHGQTISQPYIVALMTQLLELGEDDKVLEIGTGSGYQTAILAELAREVYTVEVIKPLAERAQETLKALGYQNIHFRLADGYFGWKEKAPFDAIIVTAAAEEIPTPLKEQLAEGGRMVAPLGPPEGVQTLYKFIKKGGSLVKEGIELVRFVPLTRKVRS